MQKGHVFSFHFGWYYFHLDIICEEKWRGGWGVSVSEQHLLSMTKVIC